MSGRKKGEMRRGKIEELKQSERRLSRECEEKLGNRSDWRRGRLVSKFMGGLVGE